MNPRIIYFISGYLALIIGALATFCIFRIQWMYYGVGLAIFGFVFSSINIFYNQKYFSEEESWPKGYLGMFLSSLPVIFMMLIIFRFKK